MRRSRSADPTTCVKQHVHVGLRRAVMLARGRAGVGPEADVLTAADGSGVAPEDQ